MNLLIFSKTFIFNPNGKKCLTSNTTESIKQLNGEVLIIAQNHPCYSYSTCRSFKDNNEIVLVQQYPFSFLTKNNYFSDNIRAQEGAMLILQDNFKADCIIIDNIGFALAAITYAEILNIPTIYLVYDDTVIDAEMCEINKWVCNKSNIVIKNGNIFMKNETILENRFLSSLVDTLKLYLLE